MIDIKHCMTVIATVHFQRMEKINEEVVKQYGKSEGVDKAMQNLTHTSA